MGFIEKAQIANTEAEPNIVKFGRDRSMQNPSTLEITLNGEYDVRYYAKVDVNVETNPNYKETLTGTADKLEFPDGTAVDIIAGDANASIKIDTSPLQMGVSHIEGPIFISNGKYMLSIFQAGTDAASSSGYDLEWLIAGGTASKAAGQTMGTIVDISAYLSLLPYELTIWHHKMPEA